MRSLGALGLSLFPLLSPCQTVKFPNPSHRYKATFGKPISVATGSEAVPANQGFLQCVADNLAPVFHHGATVELAQNLQMYATEGSDAVIVGHGVPGIVCTGLGDSCFGYSGQMLSSYNVPDWQQSFQQLKGKFHSITVLACDAGQGDGSQLLSAIAKATNATVIAPDTIVSCGPNGITLSPGGSWVQVAPDSAQTLPRPGRRHVKPSPILKFRMSTEFISIPATKIKLIEFQHQTYKQREFQRLDISKHSELIRLIDFSNPIVTKDRPGAIVTGHVIIALSLADKVVRKNFILYNDRLLEDSDDLDVFYDTDSDFFDAVATMVR